MSAASAVGMNPSEPGRSSKTYNVDGGVVSGRAGVTARSPNSSPLSFLALPKSGACHRFDGGRKSTGISIRRVDDEREPSAEAASRRMSPRGDIACSWRFQRMVTKADFFREEQRALQPWQAGLFDDVPGS